MRTNKPKQFKIPLKNPKINVYDLHSGKNISVSERAKAIFEDS